MQTITQLEKTISQFEKAAIAMRIDYVVTYLLQNGHS